MGGDGRAERGVREEGEEGRGGGVRFVLSCLPFFFPLHSLSTSVTHISCSLLTISARLTDDARVARRAQAAPCGDFEWAVWGGGGEWYEEGGGELRGGGAACGDLEASETGTSRCERHGLGDVAFRP